MREEAMNMQYLMPGRYLTPIASALREQAISDSPDPIRLIRYLIIERFAQPNIRDLWRSVSFIAMLGEHWFRFRSAYQLLCIFLSKLAREMMLEFRMLMTTRCILVNLLTRRIYSRVLLDSLELIALLFWINQNGGRRASSCRRRFLSLIITRYQKLSIKYSAMRESLESRVTRNRTSDFSWLWSCNDESIPRRDKILRWDTAHRITRAPSLLTLVCTIVEGLIARNTFLDTRITIISSLY